MLPTSQLKSGAGCLVQLRSGLPVRWVNQAAVQLGSSSWLCWYVPCQQCMLALRPDELQSDTPQLYCLPRCSARRGQSVQLQAEHLQPGAAEGAQDASISDIAKAAVRQTPRVRQQPAPGPPADTGNGNGNNPVQVQQSLLVTPCSESM